MPSTIVQYQETHQDITVNSAAMSNRLSYELYYFDIVFAEEPIIIQNVQCFVLPYRGFFLRV